MIPILSSTPELNAEYYVDIDVVRVPAEILRALDQAEALALEDVMMRDGTRESRTCVAAWAGWSAKNYEFLVAHALAICDEHKYRFRKVHAMRGLVDERSATPQILLRSRPLTVIPIQVNEFSWKTDEVTPEQAHRRWYVFGRDGSLHHWSRRRCPKWFSRTMRLGLEATSSLDVVF